MPNRKVEKENSWLTRVIIVLSFVAIIFITLAVYRQIHRNQAVQKDIDALREEALKVQGDNLRLSEKLRYLEGTDYQEKEIKDKLNLQGPEENVVIIKSDNPPEAKPEESTQGTTQEIFIKTSPLQKWIEYFFKH